MMKPKPKTGAPKSQRMSSTPPSRAEKGTGRPAAGRKVEAKPSPQPVPQNVMRKKGTMR